MYPLQLSHAGIGRLEVAGLWTVATSYELRYARYSANRQEGTHGGIDADDMAALAAVVCTKKCWCDGTSHYWMAAGLLEGYAERRAVTWMKGTM